MPPPPPPPPPLKLVHTTTSLRNVTIATASDEFYYEIATHKWDPLITKIKRLNPETRAMSLIAEMRMETGRSKYTGVRFIDEDREKESGAPVFQPLESFFQVDSSNTKDILGNFTGKDGQRYCWKKIKGSIELFRSDEAEPKSLARFYTHHRHFGFMRMSRKPHTDVDPTLAGTLDSVIVSFLVAEGKRRGHS